MAGESARAEARRARQRAERLARRAEAFEKGAAGEERTAEVLARLPAGWTAIHDVRWPSRRLANIDHVVVGPGGIFVVDSKNWSGRVTVDTGVLRQNGRARGVMICSTATLDEMLLSRGRVLRDGQVTEAWVRLDAELRAATEAAPATSGRRWDRAPAAPRLGRSPARATRRPSRSSRRKGSAARELRRFVAFLVMVGAFIAFGPQVLSATGELVAERLTENLTSSIDCDGSGESRQAEGKAPRDKTPSSEGDC